MATRAAGATNIAVVTNDDLRQIKADIEKTGKTASREAAILSAAEIERMKRSTKLMSKQDQLQQKRISDEQKN